MFDRCLLISIACILALGVPGERVSCQEPEANETPAAAKTDSGKNPQEISDLAAPAIEALVEKIKAAVVVISSDQVGGSQRGVGSGFVIDPQGMIATNLHVIGEGQAFRVELADGRELPVVSVHASDRFLDLAILQVDVGDSPLPALSLAEPQQALADGADIVVLGNPHGLKHSVVRGVLSARREVEGRPMLQLAVPIEPGNSGGPVVDLEGRVHGVVTMKSAVSDNLGFAVTTASLRSLIDQPNTVAYASWQTIGRIDPDEWTPLFGADWRQLGGRILVRKPGKGFGGRSLLVRNEPPPEPPYELGVSVKLDDPSGAAGIIFHSDSGDRHYGFYPTGDKVRFTAFMGPTVFSWNILFDQPSEHFRPGEFNHFKVRVEKEQILCFVNHELVFTTRDRSLANGKVGLAKFRQTVAEFRQFEVGPEITAKSAPPELVRELRERLERVESTTTIPSHELEALAVSDRVSIELLSAEAKSLEQRAAELRKLADDVHLQSVLADIRKTVDGQDDFDLLRVALLIARLDDRVVDVDSYTRLVDRMASAIRKTLPADPKPKDLRIALNNYLFRENGYHGSRSEYYHPAKRYMNRVIDDRNGLPIMLSTLYIELGRRLGMRVEGVGMPGHFIVRVHEGDEALLVDVFAAAKVIDREEAARLAATTGGVELRDEHLIASTDRQMAIRMMMNLGGIANERRDLQALHRYLGAMLAIDASQHDARFDRARVRYLTGRKAAALDDLNDLIREAPEGVDLKRAREMRDYIETQLR